MRFFKGNTVRCAFRNKKAMSMTKDCNLDSVLTPEEELKIAGTRAVIVGSSITVNSGNTVRTFKTTDNLTGESFEEQVAAAVLEALEDEKEFD